MTSDPVYQVRRGIKTIEVQAPIVATFGAWLASAAGVVPERYAAWLTAASIGCISLSRGLAKLGDPDLNRS